MNPFAIFEITPSFQVDLAALGNTYRELSKVLHPDRHVGAPAAERRHALNRAIEVNEAWRVLRDPIRRAEALCLLYGIPYGETREPKADPALLLSVLEQREALVDARRAKSVPQIERLIAEVSEQKALTLARLNEQFSALVQRGEGHPPSAKQVSDLLKELGKLRYLERFLAESNTILDELE